MIKSCKDIVDEALVLADIHNANVLSTRELNLFLQDAYSTVYNSAINAGESFYSKEGSSESPDFYLKKDYRTYYPKPDTLFYSPEAIELETSLNSTAARTFHKGKYWDGSYYRDLAKEESVALTADDVFIGDKESFYRVGDVLYSLKTKTPADGVVFTVGDDLAIYTGKKLNNITLDIAEYNDTANTSHAIYNAIDNFYEQVAYLQDNEVIVYKPEVYRYTYNLPFTPSYISFLTEDLLLVSNNYSLAVVNIFSGKIWTKERNTENFPYFNLDTGYGYIEQDVFGNTMLYTSIPEMFLDYPSQLFYNVLIYRLAIAFRTKLQQPVEHLVPLLERAEINYLDSLNKNRSKMHKVKDAYGWDPVWQDTRLFVRGE